MASQYDAIGSRYNVFKELSTSVVERENVKQAVTPYLSKTDKPRVLDLACGTGYYSKLLLDWGADYVHGTDLSGGMISAADSTLAAHPDYKGRCTFEVANALDQGRIKGQEPFDIVIGAWLLNYASDREEMGKMFDTISANLREGGVFVGITPTATDDVDGLAQQPMYHMFPESWPITVEYYERLESGDGWKTEVSSQAVSGQENVKFRNYHLKKSLYEKGAREGGMKGKLEWRDVKVPDIARQGAMSEELWKVFLDSGTHMGLLVVER